MKKLTKAILKRTIWLGRGTATVMGLAVLLALTVGLASTALAGTGVGARFDLGKTNTVNRISELVGSVAGPSLKIDNNSTASGAPALNLQVGSGKAPMKINPEAGTATGLSADELDGADSFDFARRDPETGRAFEANFAQSAQDADKLDGKDSSQFLGVSGRASDSDRLDGRDSTAFFSGKTYTAGGNIAFHNSNFSENVSASCDSGDPALSGGYSLSFNAAGDAIRAERTEGSTYTVNFTGAGFIGTNVTCADLPPLR